MTGRPGQFDSLEGGGGVGIGDGVGVGCTVILLFLLWYFWLSEFYECNEVRFDQE